MASQTVAEMTPTELKRMLETVVEAAVEQKLIELLGDPDEGLQIREAVQDRLLRQKQEVAAGQLGQLFEELTQQLGL